MKIEERKVTVREVAENYFNDAEEGPCDWDKVHKRLADLIDPTCEVKDDNRLTSDFAYVCRSCGEHFSTCNKPNYCPSCGARVIEEGE